MAKRIALGLAGLLGGTLIIVVGAVGGFFLGALPAALLHSAKLLSGPALNTALPLCGFAAGAAGCWAAHRTITRLPARLHLLRLRRARRDRAAVEATVICHHSDSFTYRGLTRWVHRVQLQWTDPATGEPRQLTRRYVLRRKETEQAFNADFGRAGHPRVRVLLKDRARPEAAIVDIPYAPAWTEML